MIHNLIGIANTSGTIRVLECFGAAIEKAPTRERRLVTNIKSAIYLGFAAAVCSNDIVVTDYRYLVSANIHEMVAKKKKYHAPYKVKDNLSSVISTSKTSILCLC